MNKKSLTRPASQLVRPLYFRTEVIITDLYENCKHGVIDKYIGVSFLKLADGYSN